VESVTDISNTERFDLVMVEDRDGRYKKLVKKGLEVKLHFVNTAWLKQCLVSTWPFKLTLDHGSCFGAADHAVEVDEDYVESGFLHG
jgi:hypothetical protein